MNAVLLLGGTGRTGSRVLRKLLDREVSVRAIVRSAGRLPEGVTGHPGLTVIEADVLALSREEMLEHVRGCDAVISCLGHTTDLKGIFGSPRQLVAPMIERVCAAAVALRPAEPIKVILMSSVAVHRSTDSPFVQWVAVRPDTLVEGDVSEYVLHEGIVSSLAKPDDTNMANVAHFMCELATDPTTWDAWQGTLPVIINAA